MVELLVFCFMSSAAFSASAASPQSQFPACVENASANAASTSTPVQDPLGCGIHDEVSPPIVELRSLGAGISASLENTMNEMKAARRFSEKLEAAVFKQFDTSLAQYDRLARCNSTCEEALKPTLAPLEEQIRAMRVELALMSPEDVSPNAMETQRGWFNQRPYHPFPKSPGFAMLSRAELSEMSEVFMRRLGQKVPSVAVRIPAILQRREVVARNRTEHVHVAQAMVKIRSEAETKYLAMISKNALLIFLSDARLPLSVSDVSQAASLMHAEITEEKSRVGQIKDLVKKNEALIEYRAAADSVLKTEPGHCRLADTIAANSASTRTRRSVLIAVGQITAGVAAFAFCSTAVACGLSAGILAAVDFGIAKDDAKEAFRSGVAKAARPDSGRERYANEAMTNADSSARFEGAILALAAPTILKAGGEVVRASGLALKAAVTKTAPVTKGRFVNEVVGGREPTRLNLISQSYFKDVLEPHTGREREIVEILIQRMQAQGIEPSKISMHLKDRLRTCAY